MISAADPVVVRAAPPAPMGAARGLFNRGEILGGASQRRRPPFHLCLSLPRQRAAEHETRRGGQRNCDPAHRSPPRSRPNPHVKPGCPRIVFTPARRCKGGQFDHPPSRRRSIENSPPGEPGSRARRTARRRRAFQRSRECSGEFRSNPFDMFASPVRPRRTSRDGDQERGRFIGARPIPAAGPSAQRARRKRPAPRRRRRVGRHRDGTAQCRRASPRR